MFYLYVPDGDIEKATVTDGWESGVVDDYNPAPKGAKLFDSADELDKAVEAHSELQTKVFIKAQEAEETESMSLEELLLSSMTVQDIAKKTKKADLLAFADNRRIDLGKAKSEVQIIRAIQDFLLEEKDNAREN